jgi:hypothetical protein
LTIATWLLNSRHCGGFRPDWHGYSVSFSGPANVEPSCKMPMFFLLARSTPNHQYRGFATPPRNFGLNELRLFNPLRAPAGNVVASVGRLGGCPPRIGSAART